jgi:uncharacterized repeat protein (TIGR01451 family)
MLRLLISLSLFAYTAIAADYPVTITVEGYAAVKESGVEELLKLDEIKPAQEVEFIVTCKNISKQPLKSWRVTMPVPKGTTLVSEKTAKRHQAPVRLSTDGGDTFAKPDAPPPVGQATHLQWRLKLPPGKSAILRYRVKAK